MKIKNIGKYNIITLNKVLEHVRDPIAMLRKAKTNLLRDGFIYIEVPDAEEASKEGKNREEFFIDHVHVFSKLSLINMCKNAGLQTIKVERINEPSGKFTLFAFISFYSPDINCLRNLLYDMHSIKQILMLITSPSKNLK